MKIFAYHVVIVVLFSAFVLGQGSTQGLNSVHSPDGVKVWAVGKGGIVFRSMDGGATWASFNHGSQELRAVHTYGDNVWIIGDDGIFQRSSDGGITWSIDVVNGGLDLNAMAFANALNGWIVGDSGTVLFTTNGGVDWVSQTSGTDRDLYSVAVMDSMTAYIVGAQGTILKTVDRGGAWTILPDNVGKAFLSVDAEEGTVIVAGADGICLKSTDGGSAWLPLDFMTDSQSDVNDVFMTSGSNAFYIGGGGYIRQSTNGGSSFRWAQHPMHARLSSIFFYDNQKGWACSDKNNAIIRTTDGGITWSLPSGTTTNTSWAQKLTASSSIGNTFVISPINKNRLYVALGRFVYMSADLGETWSQTAIISTASGSTHSFYISPKDTNVYVVAFTGGGDKVMRSTNRGLTWTTTIVRNFSSYGMPLEMDGSHPDTLIFGPEDGYLYRSKDFGATWDTVSFPNYNSPCDLQIVRDSSNIIWVGDSGPSRIYRSTDGGTTFGIPYDGSTSEIPTMANSSLMPNIGYATAWGSGGLQKTTNHGASWTTAISTGSTWGVDIAKDDPTVVMFGVYGGGTSYLSNNTGGTFTTTSLSGSNYAILAYDRATFFAQQSGGVWRYNISYTVPVSNAQAVNLVSPNGGEIWQYGTTQQIRWTTSNVTNVRIEYRSAPGQPWQSIASSTPASHGSYAWSVPGTPTTEARVRISDASDTSPLDSSSVSFAITAASIAIQPGVVNFGSVTVGQTRRDTVRITNSGNATLVVYNASLSSSLFGVGRSSLTIPAGSSDTLSVLFSPSADQIFADTLRLTTNGIGVADVVLVGAGTLVSVGEGPALPKSYSLGQNYPNPFNPATVIAYELPRESFVSLKIFNMLGEEVSELVNGVQAAGWYSAQFPRSEEMSLTSGVYFYRLQAGEFISMKKMILLK
ncbi:MAG: YCF48-related protein [Bacteroidota bacterium]